MQVGLALGYTLVGFLILSAEPQGAIKENWEVWKYVGFTVGLIMTIIHWRTAFVLLK